MVTYHFLSNHISISEKEVLMKIKSVSSYFSQALIIVISALVLVTLVKATNIILLTGSLALIFSKKLIFQLLTIAIIPDILTYIILISFGYYFMKRNTQLNAERNQRNMEIERRQASFDTAQKMTGLMIDIIGECNNQIKDWIYKRNQKGQQPPQRVEHASTMIGKSLQALTEFSYIMPYIDNKESSLDNVIEDMRLQLKESGDIKKIEAPLSLQ